MMSCSVFLYMSSSVLRIIIVFLARSSGGSTGSKLNCFSSSETFFWKMMSMSSSVLVMTAYPS